MSEARENIEPSRLGGTAARHAAAFTVVLQGLGRLVGLLVVILLVRALTEEAFGAYNVYFSIIGMIGTVFSFGIPNTLARFLPEYHKKHNDRFAHNLHRYASFARFGSNVILLALFWVFWERITVFLGIAAYAELFVVFALIVLTHFQVRILDITLSAYLLQKHSFGSQLLFGIAKLVGYWLLLFSSTVSLEQVLLVDRVAYIAMYAWLKVAYYRNAPPPVDAAQVDTRVERKRLFRYAFFYNFSDFGQFSVGNKIDVLFLAAMTEPITVGAYSLARKFERIITNLLPVKFFQGVVRPLFFTLDADSDPQKVSTYFQILTKLTYICLFPLFAGMIAAYTSISAAFLDGKFLEFADLVAVIFVFALLAGVQKPLMLVIQLREKADFVLKSKLFGILNLVLLVVLIPPLGGIGAAVATGVAGVLSRIYLWSAVRRSLDLSSLGLFAAYGTAYWTAVIGGTFFLKEYVANPFAQLFLMAIVIGVALMLFLRGPILTKAEVDVLEKILRPREHAVLVRAGLLRPPADVA
jgi:O-antigen/teichoic acid export membrane protein